MKERGIKTEVKVIGAHNGFSVLHVVNKSYENSPFIGYRVVGQWEDFRYCKVGDENKPKKYILEFFRSADDAKKDIDDYVNGKVIRVTEEENSKYVLEPNRRHSWAFSKKMLLTIMNKHKSATPKMKYLYEERLDDANFHSYARALSNEDYDGFLGILNEEYK